MGALPAQVRRTNTVLDSLMRSDEDMASLYLSHRKTIGEARHIADHQEVELLLEGTATLLEDLSDRILALQVAPHAHRRSPSLPNLC